jgi:pilus assembly protein CpaE
MTILYEPQRRTAQQVAMLLGGEVHTAATVEDLVRLLADDPGEQSVILGPGVDLSDAFALAADSQTSRPSLGMILMRDGLDVGKLDEANRAGIRQVVPLGDPAALITARDRTTEMSREMTPVHEAGAGSALAKVITIFAAKGGCGKTTLATNVSVALAAGGAYRVGLIDLDLAFGDVAIMLGLEPKRTIADAVGQQLDETLLRTLLTPHASGVDTLLAPPAPADGERVTQGLVADVLRLAGSMFDYVVLDTPAQFNDHVLTALDRAHVHVLMTTPDLPALKNLRITLDTLNQLDLPKEHRLVVLNSSDAKVGLSTADIERVIRVPISAFVPSSRDVPVSINRGLPIMVDSPQHPVSKAIREFALDRLLMQPVAARQPARGLRGLLSRGR